MKYSIYLEKILNINTENKSELYSQISDILNFKSDGNNLGDTSLKLIITPISKDILDVNNNEYLNKLLFFSEEISKMQKEAKLFLNKMALKDLENAQILLEINEEINLFIKGIYFRKSPKIVNVDSPKIIEEEIVVFNNIESIFYFLISKYLKEKKAVIRCVHCGEVIIEANRIQISNVRSGSNALHDKCREIYRKEKDSKRKRKHK